MTLLFVTCFRITTTVILCILTWILVLITGTFVLPVFLFLVLYKWIANLVVKFRHPGCVPLTALDIACLSTQTSEKCLFLRNIGCAFVVVGDVDLLHLKLSIQEKLLNVLESSGKNQGDKKYKYDRLRRILAVHLGQFYWTEEIEDLNIDKFVKERKTVKTDLEQFMNQWIYTGYEAGRPHWQVLVYKDEDAYKGKSVIAFKMSHTMGDGYALRELCGRLLGTEAPMHTENNIQKSRWASPMELLIFWTMGPFLLLRTFVTTFDLGILSKTPKLPNSIIGFMSIELEAVKQIRRAYDCKFNDVILVLFGKGVRKHLLESYSENKLPKNVTFICPREAWNRPKEICNHFTFQFLCVPVSNADPNKRMLKMREESRKAFQFSIHKLYDLISSITYFIPAWMISSKDVERQPNYCSIGMIPDLTDSGHFGPYPILNVYSVAAQQVTGIAFFGQAVTNKSTLNISLLGNCGTFQNQEAINRLKSYIKEELEVLLETVRNMSNDQSRATESVCKA